MKIRNLITIALLCISIPLLAQTKKDKEILMDAEKAETKFMEIDSNLENLFNDSMGYAIFPNVGEGALIVGAASGNGVLYENGNAVGMAKLKNWILVFRLVEKHIA